MLIQKTDTNWVVLKHTIQKNKVLPPENNPSASGNYLCTCVVVWEGKIENRYLRVMYYDKKTNTWSDSKNSRVISHIILAWRNDIKPCRVRNLKYNIGGYFT